MSANKKKVTTNEEGNRVATSPGHSELLEFIKYQEEVRKQEREEKAQEMEEKEQQRREEMEKKEQQRREEMEERERKWQREQEERERRWQEERMQMQQQFAQLFHRVEEKDREARQERQEEAAERKQEKRKEAIPKLAPMTAEADVLEYLESFEENMEKRGIDKEVWSTHLPPLLNDDCRLVTLHLEPEERAKYDTMKEELIGNSPNSARRAGETFWMLERKKGQTFPQVARILTRLSQRFAARDTVKESLDQFVIEKLLQMLPRQAATSIREKQPSTSKEAARLAQLYFQDRHSDPDDPKWWSKRSNWREKGRDGDRHNKHYRQGEERRQWREDRGVDASKKEESNAPRKNDADHADRREEKKQTGSGRQVRKGPQCYECHGWGHMRDKCPNRVLLVQSPKKIHRQNVKSPWMVSGTVNGVEVDDILLDSGADVTVLSSRIIPKECYTGGQAEARGLLPRVTKYNLADITLEVNGWKENLEVLVAPSKSLKHSVLLGRDFPGLEVVVKPPPSEVLPVITRAAALKEAEQVKRDAEASAKSGANPVNLGTVPDLPVNTEDDKQEMTEVEKDAQPEEEIGNTWQPTYLDIITDEPTDSTPKSTEGLCMHVTRAELVAKQQDDPTLQAMRVEAREKEDSPYQLDDGLLMKKVMNELGEARKLIAVPKDLRSSIFHTAHTISLAGHLGKRKTASRIAQHFYWPGLGRDVKQMCRQCSDCQKGNRRKPTRAPLIPLPVMERPWQRIAVDIVGPLDRSRRGNRYLLTVMDFATRYPEAIPLRRTDAATVCEKLIETFSRYGIPEELLSDRGSNFLAKLTKELMEKLGVKHIKTSPYHPQTNGTLERFHSTLKQMLRKTCKDVKDWDLWIPHLLFAYRETPHSTTGFAPFELMFGREIRGPLLALKQQWIVKETQPQSVVKFILDTQEKLKKTLELASKTEKISKVKMKTYYDKNSREDPLEIGDEVLVLLPEESAGAMAQWHGPFTVLEKPTPLSYIISTPSRGRRTRRFHRNLLKRFVQPVEVNQVLVAEETDDVEQLDLIHPFSEEGNKEEVDAYLSTEQKEELQSLLQEFKEVFNDTPGSTNQAFHSIPTVTTQPITQQPYRIPSKWKESLEEEVRQLLTLGVIRPSKSPWAAPVVCVQKKDKTLRMCIDYRRLNSVTKDDLYPLPRIEELLETVSGASYISTIDLAKGYYQIPVAPEDQEKTAFVTPTGKYEFMRMPFGLKGAPSTFQRTMDNILRPHKKFTSSFIDDIVVYSPTWSDHLNHLRVVLKLLKSSGLTAKLKKCFFGKAEVKYLGHVVGKGRVKPDEAKVSAIKTFATPTTKKTLRSFLGLVGYYRKFIKDFSTIAAPLTNLTTKEVPNKIPWAEEHKRSFEALKNTLTTDSMLVTPDTKTEFTLQTDASTTGIGAVLSQADSQGMLRPVAYYSRKLLKRETKYTITELECLAIVNATKHFAVYLLGNKFTVETDHAALKFLTTMKNGGPRLTRWVLSLQPFNYEVRYRKGSDNGNADGLSRQAWGQQE